MDELVDEMRTEVLNAKASGYVSIPVHRARLTEYANRIEALEGALRDAKEASYGACEHDVAAVVDAALGASDG